MVPIGKNESSGKPEAYTLGGLALSVAIGFLKELGNLTGSSLSVYNNTMLSGQVELKVGGS